MDFLVIPKGSKDVDVALGADQEMTVAENQAKVANLIAYSPTNPEGVQEVDKALSPWLSTNPGECREAGVRHQRRVLARQLKRLAERWQAWKLA